MLLAAVMWIMFTCPPKAAAENNAQIVFQGHATQQGYATGFWKSCLNWDNQYFWAYSPLRDASVEVATCEKVYRYIWLLGLYTAEAYTYRYSGIGSVYCGSGSGSPLNVWWIDKEVGETWLESIDSTYLYIAERSVNYVRIVLNSPMDSTVPPTNPTPGPLQGAAMFELQVWSMFGTCSLTKPIVIPSGVRSIDLEIDPADGSVGVIAQWSGTPPYPLKRYYDDLPVPKYPAWQSILP